MKHEEGPHTRSKTLLTLLTPLSNAASACHSCAYSSRPNWQTVTVGTVAGCWHEEGTGGPWCRRRRRATAAATPAGEASRNLLSLMGLATDCHSAEFFIVALCCAMLSAGATAMTQGKVLHSATFCYIAAAQE